MIEFFFPLFAPILCSTVVYDYESFTCPGIAVYVPEPRMGEVARYVDGALVRDFDLIGKDGFE